MNNVIYKYVNEFNREDIKNLYEDAGWTSYTKDLSKLMGSIEASLMVISAWDNDKLIGLIRVVGDGITIIYIQDILVLDSYKRKGIGTKLLKDILDKYSKVRQKVLLTDDAEETRGFYESNGFVSCDKGVTVAFAKLG
ncbi:GNAT family N-acetyltransferase [Clostridium algidicarnis]|uniref:GNAT family N-acetyltransferase n=1 Tax=Clostridium algidicarnis TaxID=37659 RepID=UPI001C0B6757|nr:GNAT family N-acetyltransferase [Clostridium algidicarnis]MBU3209745.1 GNAT family N-acetyltransferase [Clostridium algidicarnis]